MEEDEDLQKIQLTFPRKSLEIFFHFFGEGMSDEEAELVH